MNYLEEFVRDWWEQGVILFSAILILDCLQGSWLPTLRTLVTRINETFNLNFQEMAVAGEVSLGNCQELFSSFHPSC